MHIQSVDVVVGRFRGLLERASVHSFKQPLKTAVHNLLLAKLI